MVTLRDGESFTPTSRGRFGKKGNMEAHSSKVPQFRRMYSTNSLKSQALLEDNSAKARRLLFSHNKSSSDPTRFVSSPLQDPRLSSMVHGPTVSLPTLPLFLVLTLTITLTCWYLSDYMPSMSMDHPTQLSDYSIVWVITKVSDSISPLVKQASLHSWVLGPALIGVSVTTVTLVILNIDKVGGVQVESTPSLHLGEVVAVMNGLLMFLYFLFYNARVNQEHGDS